MTVAASCMVLGGEWKFGKPPRMAPRFSPVATLNKRQKPHGTGMEVFATHTALLEQKVRFRDRDEVRSKTLSIYWKVMSSGWALWRRA